MVGPFIALATDPDLIQRTPWLHQTYMSFGFDSPSKFAALSGLLVVGLFYLKGFFSWFSQKYIFDFGFEQQGELSSRLMHLYLGAPYTFHLTRNSATAIQNILNETSIFANGVLIPLLTSISNVIIIVGLLLLLVATNALATVVIAGALLLCFALFRQLRNRLSRWGKAGSEARTEIIRYINHGLGGLKETRIIGCEAYFEKRLEAQVKKYAQNTSLALSFSNLPRYLLESILITFLVFLAALSLLTERGSSQNLTSTLGIFSLASIRLLPATANLFSATNTIRVNSYVVDKLYTDFKELEQPAIPVLPYSSQKNNHFENAVAGYYQCLELRDRVTIEKLVYCYPGTSTKALNDVSLEIRKGQSIGLIGKSGSGKTTLVDVILGLLTPETGDIQIDGNSIYANLRAWQNLIGYVPQAIFLTDDTLERNIAFGVPDELIDQNRLIKAISSAQLSELIEQLPDGIHTKVGERGVLLSGGQRQRVGIARSLYHEREILVFDEATSALDNETERLVTEAINSLSGIKTMIIIAHRLSTLENCDQIYVIEKGQIVESGSYQEVVLENKILPTLGSY